MAAMGLERGLPRVALLGVQSAARSALLALGAGRARQAKAELRHLQDLAAMDCSRLALGPEAQSRLADDALAIVQRILAGLPDTPHPAPDRRFAGRLAPSRAVRARPGPHWLR